MEAVQTSFGFRLLVPEKGIGVQENIVMLEGFGVSEDIGSLGDTGVLEEVGKLLVVVVLEDIQLLKQEDNLKLEEEPLLDIQLWPERHIVQMHAEVEPRLAVGGFRPLTVDEARGDHSPKGA